MAINLGGITPAEYPEGKPYYVKLYADALIRNAPLFEHFGIHDVLKKTFPDKQDHNRINELYELIRDESTRRVYLEQYGSWQYKLSEYDRDNYIDESEPAPKETVPTFIQHNYNGTFGQINQGSDFLNSPININVNDTPIKKEKKSMFKRAWDECSKNPLISGVVLIIITLILSYFGFKLSN